MYINWANEFIPKCNAVGSMTVNLLLLYLIIMGPKLKMGNYVVLLAFFAVFNLVNTVFDILIPITVHDYKYSFSVFITGGLFEKKSLIGFFLLCLRCGLIPEAYAILHAHFIYRYFVLFRICIVMVSYRDLWPTDEHGTRYFNFYCGFGLLCFLVFSSIPLGTITYCVLKSMDKIDEFPVSEYGKDLQMQLYKALIAQTLIPVTLLFIPFTCLFVLPFFELEITVFANSLTFIYALFPVVDPLPIFFFVENYRKTVINLFTCNFKSLTTSHVTNSGIVN